MRVCLAMTLRLHPRLRTLSAIVLIAASAGACSDDPDDPIQPTLVANDFYPSWSPIADSIAFLRASATLEGPAGVYVVGSDGGTPRLIADGEFHELRHSPDGQLLLTAVQGNLITVEIATGTRTLLLAAAPSVRFPDWSPDGTRIVYAQGDAGVSDSAGLRTFDLGETADRAMRDSLGVLIVGSQPVWSPSDSLIAFERGGKIETWNVHTFAVRPLFEPASGQAAGNPIWIENGQRLLAVEAGVSTRRTVVIDVATRQASVWPIYLGPLRAIAPGDTAFVFRELDPAIADPPTYVLYRRGLTDVAGTTIHQLTHHHPNQIGRPGGTSPLP